MYIWVSRDAGHMIDSGSRSVFSVRNLVILPLSVPRKKKPQSVSTALVIINLQTALISLIQNVLISDPRRGCFMALLMFIFFFFSSSFFPPLLSAPYLWNHYSQRLQIECAAWSCCLILHYSLPSNSLRYFFFFFFFSATILSALYLWNRHS